jgi:[amino group carrier protein]-lysine/ornithine hydrolase
VQADTSTLTGLVERFSPSGSERAAAEWLAGRMASLGYEQSFVDEAGNAVGVMGAGSRQIVLLGHIDTVPGEIPVRVEEGSLYGRGAVDAKGPLACFVDAAARAGPRAGWQWVVIGAVDEEQDSRGARYVSPRYHPECAIIGEPNRWDRVCLGYKGSAGAEVTARLSQFHSAHAGESACEAAIGHWLKIKAYAEAFNTGRERMFDRLLVSLQGMQSGADGFEQWARIRIGARLPVDLPPEDWYAKLPELVPGAEVEPRGFAIPAWAGAKNSPLVRAMLASIRAAGGAPAFVYKTGTADVNIVAPQWGCPAVVYGPGDSSLDHTPDEHLELAEYLKAVEVLAAALGTLTQAG